MRRNVEQPPVGHKIVMCFRNRNVNGMSKTKKLMWKNEFVSLQKTVSREKDQAYDKREFNQKSVKFTF